MNPEIKHVVFNPTHWGFGYGGGALQTICKTHQQEGWELVRIVPNHQYESVAVFQRGRK